MKIKNTIIITDDDSVILMDDPGDTQKFTGNKVFTHDMLPPGLADQIYAAVGKSHEGCRVPQK